MLGLGSRLGEAAAQGCERLIALGDRLVACRFGVAHFLHDTGVEAGEECRGLLSRLGQQILGLLEHVGGIAPIAIGLGHDLVAAPLRASRACFTSSCRGRGDLRHAHMCLLQARLRRA